MQEELISTFDGFLKEKSRLVYFLLGKERIGKTSFLKSYIEHIRSENNIVVYLDLRNKKTDKKFLDSLPSSLFPEIFFELKNDKKISKYLTNPVNIREIDESYKFMSDATLALRMLDKDKQEEAIQFLYHRGNKKNYGIILILDNMDGFPVTYVRTIVDKCMEFNDKFSAQCIIALRDYWHPSRDLGVYEKQYKTIRI